MTGQPVTLQDGQQNNQYIINKYDLLQGYSDPEGDFLSIEEGSISANNGSLTYRYLDDTYTFTPDTDFSGQVDISYNVIDENGGSVAATQSFNINAPKPKNYSSYESEGDISIVLDDDNFGYARDADGNTQAITYRGDQVHLGYWGGDWNFLAAENIDGINSLIWKFTDSYGGYDSCLLYTSDAADE